MLEYRKRGREGEKGHIYELIGLERWARYISLGFQKGQPLNQVDFKPQPVVFRYAFFLGRHFGMCEELRCSHLCLWHNKKTGGHTMAR